MPIGVFRRNSGSPHSLEVGSSQKNASESLEWIRKNYKVVIESVFISTAIVLSYVIGRVAMGYEIIAIKDYCKEAIGMNKLSINESTYTITINPPPRFSVNGSEVQGIMGGG